MCVSDGGTCNFSSEMPSDVLPFDVKCALKCTVTIMFNRTNCYILQSEEFYSMFNGNYIVLVHSLKDVLITNVFRYLTDNAPQPLTMFFSADL